MRKYRCEEPKTVLLGHEMALNEGCGPRTTRMQTATDPLDPCWKSKQPNCYRDRPGRGVATGGHAGPRPSIMLTMVCGLAEIRCFPTASNDELHSSPGLSVHCRRNTTCTNNALWQLPLPVEFLRRHAESGEIPVPLLRTDFERNEFQSNRCTIFHGAWALKWSGPPAPCFWNLQYGSDRASER